MRGDPNEREMLKLLTKYKAQQQIETATPFESDIIHDQVEVKTVQGSNEPLLENFLAD